MSRPVSEVIEAVKDAHYALVGGAIDPKGAELVVKALPLLIELWEVEVAVKKEEQKPFSMARAATLAHLRSERTRQIKKIKHELEVLL